MRINYNVSAGIANKNLLGIENSLSQSMERLSSGLKINHSKDNPAGMAISNKMQAQIDGLNRASKNASDGISVIQIADGALNEVTSILQRMRELSVQAASDATMSLEDKKAIQAEIDSLKKEVDRISTDTEYNGKQLLNGSLDTRVYMDPKIASRAEISDYVPKSNYKLTIDSAATQAGPVATSGVDFSDTTTQVGASGVLSINGSLVDISETDTYAEAFEKIRKAAEVGETTVEYVSDTDHNITFTADAYGRESVLRLGFDNTDLATALGVPAAGLTYDEKTKLYVSETIGTDAKVSLEKPGDGTGFGNTATVAYDGNHITVTDVGGFSLSFLADADATGDLEFEVTDIGNMTLHIGANMDQNMQVRISEVSCETLYIDDLDVTTVKGGSRAIAKLDAAISEVSAVRSRLGAYQNRLEYSEDSLDEFEENMTKALSRLTDADMAEEMTEYAHQNVLNQAAISVLTQANDIPQMILQVLQ